MIMASDTETQGETKEYLCGTIAYKTADRNIIVKEFENKEDHLQWMIAKATQLRKEKHNLYVYFHNSAFDIPRLTGLKREDMKIIRKKKPYIIGLGENIGTDKERINLYLLDSMPIFQRGLDKIGERIGIRKLENKAIEEKWYSTKKQEYTLKEKKWLMERCKTDSIILLEAITEVKDNLKKEGLRIKKLMSAGQIAQKAFNSTVMKGKYRNALFDNTEQNGKPLGYHRTENAWKVREACRGGRFQAFKLGEIEKATMIDINSLYPYACTRIPFPDLRTEQMIREPLKELDLETILGQMGVTRCILEKPEEEYGIIPIRTEGGRYGVAYPKQKCTMIGTWTNIELKEFMKRGTKIKDIEYTINYGTTEDSPLSEFMKNMYEKRKKDEYNSWFYKMIMNNLTGRFSYMHEEEENVVENIDETPKMIAQGYERKMRDKYECLFTKTKEKTPSYGYAPIINTYIYAESRNIMQNEIEKIKRKDLCYMANDSIMYTGNNEDRFKIGNELGEFKIQKNEEGEIKDKPAYIYGVDNYMIGETIKLNGIGKRFQNKEDFLKGKIDYKIMYTFANAPDLERVGEFVERDRNLIKTMEKTKEKEEYVEKQKMIRDAYTDKTWFEEQGYI